jgi:ABC-type transport system substrate-binding protein
MLLASLAVTFVGFTAAQDAPFVVGTATNPPKIDPQDQYDSESAELIGQVCEGLLRYNYTSPEMEGIPQLAASVTAPVGNEADGYNYTVTLRDDVTFHDGTPFNASAVKWTFDRIQHFSYGYYEGGVLISKSAILMESYSIFAVSGTPILNSTVIESEFVVRFVLNTAPGFFEKLLAFMATQMMLPDEDYEKGVKFNSFLGLDDELIGTGPFELVQYVYDNQVVFKAYDGYYLTKPVGGIENMIYLIVPDDVTRSLAILNYEIHWGPVLNTYDEEFAADPNLVEVRVSALVVFYIQMNMVTMPTAVRQASMYAYNYTYLHEDRHQNASDYLHTPVPTGMLYHHEGFEGEPYMNLTLAREIILAEANGGAAVGTFERNISDSLLTITNTTAEWEAVGASENPIAWFNFTGYSGLENHFNQLSQNMQAIGIRVDMNPLMPWGTYLDEYLHDEEGNQKLTYSFGGWGPDYNDPINMIEPLYGRNAEGGPASANCFLLNDPTLNDLLNDTYFTTDLTTPTREDVFKEIQEYLVVDLAPSFYIYQRISSLSFNRLYVDENTIDDMKNAFNDYYWFNVVFYPPERVIPGFEVFTLLAVALGVTIFLVFYLRKRR